MRTGRRLPPLTALPAFETTIRLGSMTRAAQELGRTHGAVSRQIRSLEEALGTVLVDRDHQPLRPTPAGAQLYAAVAAAFDHLEAGLARVAPQGMQRVRLACGSTLATRWLVPRLPHFYEGNPGVSVALTLGTSAVPEMDDADLAVTWNRLDDHPEGEHVQVLGDVRFALVTSPESPVEVLGRTLRTETLLVADTMPDGVERLRDRFGFDVAVRQRMALPHIHLCIGAAVGGLGVTLVEARLVQDELADGRLVAPLGFQVVPDGFLAVLHPKRPRSAAVRKLVRWLEAEAGSGA
jgi:LysR family transcriptional regulator, glycine cleavage system transcriptional activator